MSVSDTIQSRKSVHGDYATQSLISMNILQVMRQSTRFSYLSAAQQESLILIAVKIGRILAGNPNEPDHWHDIAGYAQLVENILNGQPANGVTIRHYAGAVATKEASPDKEHPKDRAALKETYLYMGPANTGTSTRDTGGGCGPAPSGF